MNGRGDLFAILLVFSLIAAMLGVMPTEKKAVEEVQPDNPAQALWALAMAFLLMAAVKFFNWLSREREGRRRGK